MYQEIRKLSYALIAALILFGGLFAFPNGKAQAAVGINKKINFQGKVTNTDGTNVANASYNFLFCVYTVASPATACTAGANNDAVWRESKSITVTDGIFQTNLGDTTAFAALIDFNSDNIYLGVNFNSNGQMTPLVQFTANPYSFNSDLLDGKDWATPGAIGTTTAAAGTFTNLSTTTGGLSIAAGQSYSGAGAVTLSSGAGTGLTLSGNAASSFDTTAGNISLQAAGSGTTANVQIGAGGAGSGTPDYFGLDVKNSSGDPAAAGFEGAMYYNTTDNKFRCFEGAGWKDCDTGGAGSGYATIQNEGSALAQENTVNFTGAGINCTAGTGVTTCDVAGGAGGGISLAPATADADSSVNPSIFVNDTAGGNLLQLQKGGIDKFIVANNGGLTVNGSDSSIVRQTAADFALGTIGSSLTNTDGALSLADTVTGGIPNSGKGTIATGGPTTSAAIGAGSFSITRADGKYLVIRGGGTGMDVYDSIAETFTSSSMVLNAAAGVGAIALPRPGGLYRILHGGGATTSSLVDPMGAITPGVSVTVTAKGAGTVAFLRPNGRYLVTNAPALATTQIYEPITDTFVTGPSGTGGNWGIGAVVLPRNDGQALILVGGTNISTTQLYNSSAGALSAAPAAPIGAFTAGPSLDGNKAAGTCAMNGAGSVAFKKQDGKYVILSKANVWAVYDSTSNTMTCNSSGGPATAIGDGGHAIPLQDGKFLIIVGGGSTNSYIYNPADDSFTAHGTALSAVSTGAHSIMESDGTWHIVNGAGTATNSYNTGLPMSDSTTKYVSEDIFSSAINPNSSFWWRAQIESAYTNIRNGVTNTAFTPLQFLVKTATSSNGLQSGCATPLNSAIEKEINSSGDLFGAATGNNCIRVSVQYNRPLPKRLFDERGTWIGNGMVVTRFDEITPRLYNYKIDNTAVLKRSNFDFSTSNSSNPTNPTIPAALTAAQSATGGTCTAGTHAYYSTFITDNVESALSTKSNVVTCVGGTDKVNLTNVPLGPAGTTARKIYRTAAGDTGTPFLVTTLNDNTTTTLTSDTAADSALGAAYASVVDNSGPIMSRSETRVETVNGNLVLPYGRLTPTSQIGTTGYYMGLFSNAHPKLTNPTGMGTTVIARDDKTFLIIETGGQFAEIYDPTTETFINQTGAGNVPTGNVGAGAFALKRADGNFLVYLGLSSTTTTCTVAGTATNIYDQNQVAGSRFSNGPCLTAAGGVGAQAILNNDGTHTIMHGNQTTATSIYNQMTNTMMVGPITTTAISCGAWAIPMGLPNNNQYKVKVGAAPGIIANATTMNYDANSKVFVAGPNSGSITGCGSMAFQRQDGYWVVTEGETAGLTGTATNIINPITGISVAGPALVTGAGRGSHVIPRADGTFLVVNGNFLVNGNSIVTQIYFPTAGAIATGLTVPMGSFAAGPNLSAGAAPGTALTAGTATTGTGPEAGTHSWKFTYVTNGVESLPAAQSNTLTIVGGTQVVPLSVIGAGPTGTTARKVYRTAAGQAATGPWKLLTTINDNTTLTFSDTIADASLGATLESSVGDGALSFQRPDGKFVTLFGGANSSKGTNLYDAGWYPDGQYMSEMMPVPALAANATLEWQKTSDAYVRFEARVANSQSALGSASFKGVDSPGSTINNAGGETWAQVEINFRRDFPTFCGNLSGVWLSGAGMAYCGRNISLPTVLQYQLTNGQDLLSLQTNSYNVLRVTSNGGIYSSQQGGFFAGGADLAENYTSAEQLEKGEIVTVDPTDNHNVKRSQTAYQKDVLGIVSTAPGFVAGAYTENSYPIALVGRVPVNVSTENGMIKAGDRITSASIPGFGMRATVAGRVLGTALESMDLTKMGVCPAGGIGGMDARCGQIMVFVNLADYQGMSAEQLMSEVENNNLNVAADNEVVASPVVSNSPFEKFTAQGKVLTFLETLKENQATVNGSDIFTKNINVTNQIISPLIVTDTLVAKHIKAESIEGLEFIQTGLDSANSGVANNASEVKSLGQQIMDLRSNMASLSEKNSLMSTGIIKDFNTDGSLAVGAKAEFAGPAFFKSIVEFIDKVIFRNNVEFEGQVTFNKDSAGYAIIKEGTDTVGITFEKEYAVAPIVNASLSLQSIEDEELRKAAEQLLLVSDVKFVITNVTTKGLEIRISQKAISDIPFSWQAIAINGAKTFESKIPVLAIEKSDIFGNAKNVPLPVETALPVVEEVQSVPEVNTVSNTDTTTTSVAGAETIN